MKKKVAFLRGINIGAHNRINMKLLTQSMLSLGLKNVSTYIQSGNLLFESDKLNLHDLIREKILQDFKLNIAVVVRTQQEVETLIKHCPFDDRSHTYITLLSKTLLALPNIEMLNTQGDTCVLYKDNIYIHCIGQYHKTTLSNAFFEKKLNLFATTRNMHTIQEIVKLR